MKLMMNPWQYDVVVTTNQFGDILTDQGAGLVGGLGEGRTLLRGPADAAAAEAGEAIAQTGGRGILVGPGCVLPLATPDAHLSAVLAAVKAAR